MTTLLEQPPYADASRWWNKLMHIALATTVSTSSMVNLNVNVFKICYMLLSSYYHQSSPPAQGPRELQADLHYTPTAVSLADLLSNGDKLSPQAQAYLWVSNESHASVTLEKLASLFKATVLVATKVHFTTKTLCSISNISVTVCYPFSVRGRQCQYVSQNYPASLKKSRVSPGFVGECTKCSRYQMMGHWIAMQIQKGHWHNILLLELPVESTFMHTYTPPTKYYYQQIELWR